MDSARDVAFNYVPRKPFIEFHNRRQRFAIINSHRRSGKTVAIINDLIIGALEEDLHRPQLAYIGPTYTQAKRVAWEYLKDYARPFLDGTPNESELRVTLKNDARIFLAGSDNRDSLRGLYLDGAVIDEAAASHPQVWTQIILPALADRQGWAVIVSTPLGKNHFYDMWRMSENNPEWFRLRLSADTSGILPPEELALLRREMPPDEYEQEMLVSFTATSKGAILFREVEQAERDGRVMRREIYDPTNEVYVAADIGFRDTAAFWYCQKAADGVNVIDHDEDSGLDAHDWIERLRNRNYPIDEIWLPHDAHARTFQTRHTAQETFMRTGLRVRIVPRTSVLDRVNAARRVIRYCRFDGQRCKAGLSALREWMFEWDNDRKEYSKTPLHNWASHSSDSFSYLCQMIGNHVDGMRPINEPPAPPRPLAVPLNYSFTLDELFEHGRL